MAQKISVDAMGKECPIPVVMTLKAMRGLTEATTCLLYTSPSPRDA